MPGYQPIENYGIIGDLNTTALVGLNGSIDFMCFPDFDSPSIFAALLDSEKGGSFEIAPAHGTPHHKQMYLPDTNVLLTRFLSEEGVGEVTDFMPVDRLGKEHALIRRVTHVRGEITYRMRFRPRFDYARIGHAVKKQGNDLIFISDKKDGLVIRLKSTIPLEIKDNDGYAEFCLRPGQKADFLMEQVVDDKASQSHAEEHIDGRLFETMNYWKQWIGRSQYKGRWRETVNRSALVLKLMISQKYGSIVAAPTFGLPEEVGGDKNWDYRYTWIRDAAFTLYALIRLGYTKEAGQFMHWIEKVCSGLKEPGGLALMYGIDGRKELEEINLTHLEGYKGSSPVRIGNAAYKQLQLDIYGELMDSIYLFNKYGDMISNDFWNDLSLQIDWLCENWEREDHGIWEVRGPTRLFLYSTLMCWVAMDRAVRLAEKRSFPRPERWVKERDRIYNIIYSDFWDDKRGTFVQFRGGDKVDASTLLMPLVRFISPKDPRWLSTLKCIEEDLVSDSLVYRYCPDEDLTGLKSGEGTFSLCSFWYVECLSRSGQLQKARFYFEKMLGYSNHLGLFSEQIGLQGEHLGNTPQAFTHLGLISAAFDIDRRLNDTRNQETPI